MSVLVSAGETIHEPSTTSDPEPSGAERRNIKAKATCVRPEIPEGNTILDAYEKKLGLYTGLEDRQIKAWSDEANRVREYSDEMIKRWKEEIDNYLTFAGLFSAVLTTFNVQSYPLLKPAPPDTSGDTNANTSPPAPRWTVWLNALWFSSLILSLTSASVGIMVKQWLNEYISGVSGDSRSVAQARQYRLNHLRTWHVQDVVNSIPVLLQLALALFLSGLLILLWNYNETVAIVASTLVGLLVAFTALTTLLPLANHTCSYLTPQIRTIYSLWQPKRLSFWICATLSRGICSTSSLFSSRTRITSRVGRVLRRMGEAMKRPETWREHKQTWQGRERSAIDRLKHDLDLQTLLEAYNITLHPDALSAAGVCLMCCHSKDVVDYFRKIHKSAREHFGAIADSGDGPLSRGSQQRLLWLNVVLCTLHGHHPLSRDEAAALSLYFRVSYWPPDMTAADAEWAVCASDAIVDYLEGGGAPEIELTEEWLQQRRGGWIHRDPMRRTEALEKVELLAVRGSYRQVRIRRQHIPDAASVDTWQPMEPITWHTHYVYLSNVNHFLWCANEALSLSLLAEDEEAVRTWTGDVLVELTDTLLHLLQTTPAIEYTIRAFDVSEIMKTLAEGISDNVLRCIPDHLCTDLLRLTDELATPRALEWSTINYWHVSIPEFSLKAKAKIIRIKCEPIRNSRIPPQTASQRSAEARATTSAVEAVSI